MNKFLTGVSMVVGTVVVVSSANAAENYNVTNVYNSNNSDYTAKGANLGAFNVKPSLSVKAIQDDNIFATDTNEIDDTIMVYTPKVEIGSNWSRHALTLSAKSIIGEYASSEDENYDDFNITAGGRVDISRRTYITVNASTSKSHEDRGSADDLNGVEPTEYTTDVVALGFSKSFNKVTVSIDSDVSELDYDDVFTSAGAELDNDDRDRTEYETSLKLAYEVIPAYEAFIRTTYRKRDYDNTAIVNRNSDGYEVNIGTDIDLSSKVKGEVFTGYLRQDYDDSSLGEITSPTFGASVLWTPNRITSVNASLDQTSQETAISTDISGYVATNANIRVEHELRRNILLSGDLGYLNSAYEGAAAGQSERDDDLISAGVGVKYMLNRRFSVNAGYSYQDRSSNIAGQDYTRNKVMLNLRGAL